jgi:hypothetical protein
MVYCVKYFTWEGLHYYMSAKRPYKHILKNLLHEQAGEIIPLLLPGFQVVQALE